MRVTTKSYSSFAFLLNKTMRLGLAKNNYLKVAELSPSMGVTGVDRKWRQRLIAKTGMVWMCADEG